MRTIRTSFFATAAVTAAAAVSLLSAAPAQAAPALNCKFSSSGRTLSAYCYDSGTDGKEFRARVGCAVWSGGYEVYSRYGTWRTQSGGTWSSASCDSGHYAVRHGVALR